MGLFQTKYGQIRQFSSTIFECLSGFTLVFTSKIILFKQQKIMSVYHISHEKDDIVPESYKLNVDDPSLNDQKASALKHEYNSSPKTLNQLFFAKERA